MPFAAVLGGQLFDVDSARLMPFLPATIPSGVAQLALELASTCAWLFMGKGLIVLVKLALLLMVQLFWESREPLLLLVVAIASVGSHMPSRYRHRCDVPAARQYCAPASELSSQNHSG